LPKHFEDLPRGKFELFDPIVVGASQDVRLRIASLSVRALKVSVVIIVLVCATCCDHQTAASSKNPCPVGNSSVFHAPASGVCPEGFSLRKGFFTERDGSTRSARVSRTHGDGSTDCLMPGESMGATIVIEQPETPKGKI
jgi:hypothetical protein